MYMVVLDIEAFNRTRRAILYLPLTATEGRLCHSFDFGC